MSAVDRLGSVAPDSPTPWWLAILLAILLVALGYAAIRLVRAGSTRSMLEQMRRGRRR